MNKNKTKNVVVLGKFDGVHIGHQRLINTAVSIANEKDMKTLVYTIVPTDSAKAITTEEKKEEIIKSLGADTVLRQYLTDDFKSLSPEEFVHDILISKLNAGHVVVGYNFRFGAKRTGDVKLLISLCREYNIGITVIESVMTKNDSGSLEPVSSTRIRGLIENGKTEETEECLGRYFCMWGIVSEGKHLGRKIGFPTVNFYPDSDALIPKHGVYAVMVYVDGNEFFGITNVGINPTVENGENIKIETFIFGFDGNEIYGSRIRIKFIEFVRGEIKFEGVDELKYQIEKDKKYVMKKYLQRGVCNGIGRT